jgi:dinuclear metal center YbgI/SA1388 family protein
MIHLLNRLSAISHITKTLSIPSIVQFCHRSGIHCSGARSAMDVPSVVNVLESIAPLNVAEDWDNVGLLVQPSTSALINHIFLTIDLTEPVLQEALTSPDPVGMIVSYHPPIFRPLKRLTQSTAKERIVIKAVEAGVAVYSPHTAHDSLWGGVNDWILRGFDKGSITPLSISQVESSLPVLLMVSGLRDRESCDGLIHHLKITADIDNVVISSEESSNSQRSFQVKLHTKKNLLKNLLPELIQDFPNYKLSLTSSPKVPMPGPGRLLMLNESVPFHKVISQIKNHLKLDHIRVALPHEWSDDSEVSSIATCVGSGGSVLKGMRANVYLTGYFYCYMQ